MKSKGDEDERERRIDSSKSKDLDFCNVESSLNEQQSENLPR